MENKKLKFLKCNIGPAFRRLLLDRPSPMFVELFVTRRCNLRCSYCFTWREGGSDPSISEVKQRIDKIKELGCNVISFMGGEPTLREDLPELVKYCSNKKMFVSMDTNGLLLDKNLIDKLSDAGLDAVVVSVDGINKLKSSKKTFAANPRVLSNLIYASKKINAFVNLVLTKENIDEVIPMLDMLKGTGIIFTLSLITKNPECRLKGVRKYSADEISSFDRLFEELIDKKKSGYLMFEPLEYYIQLKDFIRGKFDWHCTAGRHFFSVDADGKFLLCSDSKPLDINIMQMGKDYWKAHKDTFKAQLARCNATCPENYAYCAGHFSKNKMEFVIHNGG